VTIAVCYLTPEGVVLGADSTTSMATHGGMHYFNHAQKLFEIGEDSTLGAVTWGVASVSTRSYRTLLALLADKLKKNPARSVHEVARRWADLFWPEYSKNKYVQLCKKLHAKKPYDPKSKASSRNRNTRTEVEEEEYGHLTEWLIVGFCIAGYTPNRRVAEAYQTLFDPLADKPDAEPVERLDFWGAQNMVNRLINGHDLKLAQTILDSGKWSGSKTDLNQLLSQQALARPLLPMRDAIDFVHTCIYSTIKALKFSHLSQICGGPIEIAVITTDRKFRWVRHKEWDVAISEGTPYEKITSK
jgi:20S proteasome alpha/beta subunit